MTQNILRHIVFISLLALASEVSATVFPTYSSKTLHSYSSSNYQLHSTLNTQHSTLNTQHSTSLNSQPSTLNSQLLSTSFTSMPKVQSVANGSCFASNAPLITHTTSYTLQGSVPPPYDPDPKPEDQLPVGDSLALAVFASLYSLIRFKTFDISDVSNPREAAKR